MRLWNAGGEWVHGQQSGAGGIPVGGAGLRVEEAGGGRAHLCNGSWFLDDEQINGLQIVRRRLDGCGH